MSNDLSPDSSYRDVVSEIIVNVPEEVTDNRNAIIAAAMKKVYDEKMGAGASDALPAGIFDEMWHAIELELYAIWQKVDPFPDGPV